MMCIRIVMEKKYNSSYSSVRNWYTIVSFSLFSFPLHYHFCYSHLETKEKQNKKRNRSSTWASKQNIYTFGWSMMSLTCTMVGMWSNSCLGRLRIWDSEIYIYIYLFNLEISAVSWPARSHSLRLTKKKNVFIYFDAHTQRSQVLFTLEKKIK